MAMVCVGDLVQMLCAGGNELVEVDLYLSGSTQTQQNTDTAQSRTGKKNSGQDVGRGASGL